MLSSNVPPFDIMGIDTRVGARSAGTLKKARKILSPEMERTECGTRVVGVLMTRDCTGTRPCLLRNFTGKLVSGSS